MSAESIDEEERRRTAWHEAGHAAVAAHLGLHFHTLRLEESCLISLEDEDASSAARLELARKQMVVAYTGKEAQSLVHPYVLDILASSVSDLKIVDDLKKEFGFSQRGLKEAEKQARSLVQRLKGAIQEIAEALLAKGELAESEVLNIVRRDRPNNPGPKIPGKIFLFFC